MKTHWPRCLKPATWQEPGSTHLTSSTYIIRIRRALFKRMIQEYPELARRLFEQHVSRYRHTISAIRPIGDKMSELEQLNAERRVENDSKS